MRNQLAIIFLVTTICSNGYGQNKLTDSLKQLLAITKVDSSRVIVLTNLGLQYRNTNPDSSVYFSEKALALAQQIKFKRGEAFALTTMGLALREKGDLPKSLELQIKALQIAEPNNFPIEAAFCLRRIGLVYMDLNDYPTCLNYLYQALSKQEAVQYKRGMAIEYMNLGMTYEYMNRIDSALYFTQKAEDHKELIEDLYPEVNRVFGNIYARKGDYKTALQYYNKGIKTGSDLNDYRTVSFIYSDAAKMFRNLNQIDSSIVYAKKGVEFGQMASYKKGILFSATILSELLDATNPKEALDYYKIASAAKDSLFGAGNITTIQTLFAKEEARQKEIELAKTAYKDQLKQYGLLGGLGVFSIIAIILYRNNRQKQKANAVLEKTLIDLRSTQSQLIQAEKMASLGELTAGIAHEIQNPLNFVNNFSEVNKELLIEMKEEIEKGNLDEVRAIVNDMFVNEEKINEHGRRADAIVKGMLQHSQKNNGAKEPTNINALADEYLRLAYHGLKAKDRSFNALIKTDFDESIGTVNIIPQDIGRVLLNLINNAFYAVNEKKKLIADGYDPEVTVSTRMVNATENPTIRQSANSLIISVRDNGNGIPENIRNKIFQPFFTTKPTGQGTGLGLSLSYDIVKAHGGELEVESTPGKCSSFHIMIPINN